MTGPDEIRVVAAVIEREGRYLLGRRPDHKRHGGLWEFPGGKLDPGEDYAGAATRELAEELELEVTSVGGLLLSCRDDGSPFVIDFIEVEAVGTARALEHSEIGWFTPAELAALETAPADRRFVESLG
jgi:8-oxo-dGTP pyrophosphatase MutT (NUDIX family)